MAVFLLLLVLCGLFSLQLIQLLIIDLVIEYPLKIAVKYYSL